MNITRLALLVAALCFGSLCFAQNSNTLAITDADFTPDVRVIIDISGSMKKNDPQNLRRPALELLVQLFPEGSKAGVWTFGQWVNNLVPSKNVDQLWRDGAFSQAAKINSVALRTNIPAALEKAMDDVDKLDPRYKVHLILLTDGMVDVSKSAEENQRARQRIIDVILPKLRDAGVTIHTVALSQNADQELMERLAVETDGLAAVAQTAEDLTNIFVQAFDAAAPAEQLPLEDNGFTVDSSIDEFTALIFRQQGSDAATLISPRNQRYTIDNHGSDISWFRQQNYDLITVKKPDAGDWAIEADLEPNSRITIVSNLSLKVNPLPKSNFVGDTAEVIALLTEQDAVIDRSEFLNLVDMSFDVTRRDDGQQWQFSLSEADPIPVDGMFRSSFEVLQEVGIYDVVVRANGKTFQRQKKQTMAVREAFDIRNRSTKSNPPSHKVSLFARNHNIDGDRSTATASITLPDGSQQNIEAIAVGDRRWQINLDGINAAGYYAVNFVVNGQLNNGDSFTAQTHTFQIEHPVQGQLIAPLVEAEPQPEPEPVAEPEQPEEEPAPEPVPEPTPETEIYVEEGTDWAQIGLYGAIGVGNLLVVVLGFFAYKMVKGSNTESDILDSDDEVEVDDDEEIEEEEPEVAAAVPDPVPEPAPEPEPAAEESDDFDIEIEDDPEDVEDLDTELLDVGEVDVEDVDVDLEDTVIEEEPLSSEDDIDEVEDLDDILDLPDDAIDIDPGSEDDK